MVTGEGGSELALFTVDEAGTGPLEPLLVIHGYPTSSYDFAPMMDGLKGMHSRVALVDLLGLGFSDKPWPYSYSVTGQADLVEQVLAQLGVARMHVLAHDLGDTVAQELLYRDRGRRVASVAFLNGGLDSDMHRPLLIQSLARKPFLGDAIMSLFSERLFRRSLARVFGTMPSDRHLRDLWALVSFNHGKRTLAPLLGYIAERAARRADWFDGAVVNLSRSVPTILIDGPADPVSGAHLVEHMQAIPSVTTIALPPHIGHFPPTEAPDLVLNALSSWSRQVPLEAPTRQHEAHHHDEL